MWLASHERNGPVFTGPNAAVNVQIAQVHPMPGTIHWLDPGRYASAIIGRQQQRLSIPHPQSRPEIAIQWLRDVLVFPASRRDDMNFGHTHIQSVVPVTI